MKQPITYMDLIALAIAVGIWLIFLFGVNVAG